MTEDPGKCIKMLARKCADRGLAYSDAKDLFTAMYLADCLAVTGGHKIKAAQKAKTARTIFNQRKRVIQRGETE